MTVSASSPRGSDNTRLTDNRVGIVGAAGSPKPTVSSIPAKHSSKAASVAVGVVVSVLAVVVALFCYFKWRRRPARRRPRDLPAILEDSENRVRTPSGSEVEQWVDHPRGGTTHVETRSRDEARSSKKLQPSFLGKSSLVLVGGTSAGDRGSTVFSEESTTVVHGTHQDLREKTDPRVETLEGLSVVANGSGAEQAEVVTLRNELEQMRQQMVSFQTQVVDLMRQQSRDQELPPVYENSPQNRTGEP